MQFMTMRFSRLISSCFLGACALLTGATQAHADRPWQDAPVPARFISDHPLSSPVEGSLTALPSGTLYSLDSHGKPQRIDLVDGQIYPLDDLPPLTTLTANNQGLWGITAGSSAELLSFAPSSGTIASRFPLKGASHSGSRFSALQVTDQHAYLVDDLNPAFVVIDLDKKQPRRLLEGSPSLSSHSPLRRDGKEVTTADGTPRSGGNVRFMVMDHSRQWLFYQTPTGPLYRLATALVTDPSVSPIEQLEGMANWRRTPSLGGLAISKNDTLYMVDIDHGDLLAFGADRIPLRLLHDPRLTHTRDIALLPRSSRANARIAVLLEENAPSSPQKASHIAEIGLP